MPGSEQRHPESLPPARWIGENRSGTLNTYAMAARALREHIVQQRARLIA